MDKLDNLIFPEQFYEETESYEKWDSYSEPFEDESFLSWFTRIAKDNYSDVDLLFVKFGHSDKKINRKSMNQKLDIIQINKEIRLKLLNNLKDYINLDQIAQDYLVNGPFKNFNHNKKSDYFLIPNIVPNYCPYCFNEDKMPYFRYYWFLRFYLVCHIHNILLKNKCPHCYSLIKFWSTKWDKSIIDCVNCGKSIIDDLNLITNVKNDSSTNFHLKFLMIYQKNEYKGNFINSIEFFRQLFKLLILEVNDEKIKRLNEEEIYIENDRLMNGILIVYRIILKDVKRIERPYFCEIDQKYFFSIEELIFHQKNLHSTFILKNLDDDAKFKYEIISPLLEMMGRTKNDVENRARLFGKSTTSIYRYIQQFELNSFKGLESLHHKKGNRMKKISEEVDGIIQKHINNECICCTSKSKLRDKYRKIKEDCLQFELKPPSFSTIRRRYN